MIEAEWRAYDTTAEMADAVADEIGYLIEVRSRPVMRRLLHYLEARRRFRSLNGWRQKRSTGTGSPSFRRTTALFRSQTR